MWFEGEGFVNMNAEVLDASAWLYGLIVYCKGWMVGELFCLVLAVARQAVQESGFGWGER
jgi:hypothetical protein